MVTTVDGTFAALGDPTRLEIVLRLGRGPASVSELGEPHEMSFPRCSSTCMCSRRPGLCGRRRSGVSASASCASIRSTQPIVGSPIFDGIGNGDLIVSSGISKENTMDDTTVRIERVIDAKPQAVFDAWTSADAIRHWYRDAPDHEVSEVELDVHVGGRYRIVFGPPGEPGYVETGEYVEIDPPRRLVLARDAGVTSRCGLGRHAGHRHLRRRWRQGATRAGARAATTRGTRRRRRRLARLHRPPR